jgi:hypothetical protein
MSFKIPAEPMLNVLCEQLQSKFSRSLYMRPTPKFPDFYQDFLIDGYMAAI